MQTSQISAPTAYPVRDGRSGVTNFASLEPLGALLESESVDATQDALKRLLEPDEQDSARNAVPPQFPHVPTVHDNVQQDLAESRETARAERHTDRAAFAQQRAAEKRASFQKALRDAQPKESSTPESTATKSAKPAEGVRSESSDSSTSDPKRASQSVAPSNRGAGARNAATPEKATSLPDSPPTKLGSVSEPGQKATPQNANATQSVHSGNTPASGSNVQHSLQSAQASAVTATGAAARAASTPEVKAGSTTQRPAELGVSDTKAANRATNRTAANAKPSPDAETARQEVRIEQMLRVLRAQIHRKDQRAIIHLRPQELGPVKVDLQFARDGVGIRIEAESSAARDLLSKHIEALRSGLESAGIRIEGLVVGNASEAATSDHASSFAESGGFSQEASQDDRRQESATSSGTPGDGRQSTEVVSEDRLPARHEIAAQDARINLVA
ncbi:MAG: flagellar hook-length control protein FliK [Phycisphaerae bacterium]